MKQGDECHGTGPAETRGWVRLREEPLSGLFALLATDISLRVLPDAHGLSHQVPLFAAALVINGLGGALYIGSQLGPGPRDGLMTGLARRTGLSLRLVRTLLEVAAS